jgi:anti-sigma regulatory factor (Ser/Thr protein kinase)
VPNDVLDIAELLASEIVTNAVVHAKGPRDGTVCVAALRSGERLIVECHDPSSALRCGPGYLRGRPRRP